VKAFRLVGAGHTDLVDVDDPEPGPGQVALRIASASFCHSDLELLALPANVPGIPLPVTLGHEMAGWVEAVGPDVDSWEVGTPVAVHIIQGCGECPACITGRHNVCDRGVLRTPGVHYDGAMAERMVVDARHLIALDGVDPTIAAPLTDAGLTAYHAVEWGRPRMGPGATVLVVGVGGLGHLAVQIVAATSASTIFAVDVDVARVALAERLGAFRAFVAGPGLVGDVRAANGGRPVDVVLDFVGSQETVELDADLARRGGMIVVAGMGGGVVPFVHGFGGPARRVPPETPVVASFAGARSDLVGVLALARRGVLHVEATTFPLVDAPRAFAEFAAGGVLGRAVVVPT
jgi:propanol-preferring alcohol dehydrogenase